MISSLIMKISRRKTADVLRLGATQTYSFRSLGVFLPTFSPFLPDILHKTESSFCEISIFTFHKSANGKNTWGVCHDSFSIS